MGRQLAKVTHSRLVCPLNTQTDSPFHQTCGRTSRPTSLHISVTVITNSNAVAEFIIMLSYTIHYWIQLVTLL